jgi:3-methylcrotonyl-CoA carboxylase alpha subunit
MTPEIRQRMGEAAIAAARAVQYVGAGTVEFVVESLDAARANGGSAGSAASDAPGIGAFYFMEMNTRMQVEHPVTEAITGLDLVEWQLRAASGERLPLIQPDLQINGHAIEARICAETPDAQFLPATGALDVYELPPHASFARAPNAVRIDSGVRQGDRISPYYDSMVAKLIVHGSARDEALARMDAALSAVHIVGLSNNVQFLRRVVNSNSFRNAHLDTGLIPREAVVLFDQEPLGLAWVAAAAVSHVVTTETAELATDGTSGWVDPWAQRDSWHSHSSSVRRIAVEFHGVEHQIALERLRGGGAQLRVDAQAHALHWERAADSADALVVTLDGQRAVFAVYRQGDALHVFGDRGASSITLIDPLAHAGDVQEAGGRLTAPMPGKVVSFSVEAGDQVVRGQPLAVMEAMKMEHTIAAPADGTVGELLFAPGEQVPEGAALLRLVL